MFSAVETDFSPDVTSRLLVRNRRIFQIGLALFVILFSFIYGVTVGVRRKQAVAALPVSSFALSGTSIVGSTGFELPAGVMPISLGDKIEVNGKPSDVVMFRTERSPRVLVNEQVAIWKRKGFVAAGRIGGKRGVALGYDPLTGKRYSLTIWTVPPTLRDAVSEGAPVEGIIASSAPRGALPSSTDTGAGLVPGIPVMPDGRGGAVFSSVGAGGRSYSGGYTNPGTVEENLAFYRGMLGAEGWTETTVFNTSEADSGKAREVGSLRFVRGAEEIVLLFAPREGYGASPLRPETVVNVIRGPNLMKY